MERAANNHVTERILKRSEQTVFVFLFLFHFTLILKRNSSTGTCGLTPTEGGSG